MLRISYDLCEESFVCELEKSILICILHNFCLQSDVSPIKPNMGGILMIYYPLDPGVTVCEIWNVSSREATFYWKWYTGLAIVTRSIGWWRGWQLWSIGTRSTQKLAFCILAEKQIFCVVSSQFRKVKKWLCCPRSSKLSDSKEAWMACEVKQQNITSFLFVI